MADIFISYARDDHAAAEAVARLLQSAGHSVWWDRHIRGGAAYAKDIEKELQSARVVLVLWSRTSIASDWVKDEATFGRDRQILVPVSVDGVEQPLGFRQYQAISLRGWKGDADVPGARELLETVAERLNAPAPPSLPARSRIHRLLRSPAALAGAAIVLVGALVGAYALFAPDEPGRARKSGEPLSVSVAVMPFVDMSESRDQEYFADGIAEEILYVLKRVEGLEVAPRASAFALKDQALASGEIAARLGVRYVLDGSIRRSGQRLVVTAQLSEGERSLWSEKYDRRLSVADIVDVQEEIASSVVGAMRAALGLDPAKAPIEVAPATDNLDAYEMYLKARQLYAARGKTNVREALRLFEKVVELDPNSARGWEGLSAVYAIARSWDITDRDYPALALDAAAKALDIDPTLSMPYAVTGFLQRARYPTPWAESIDNLEKAVERDPTNTSALQWLGQNYMSVGLHDRAVEAFSKCLTAEPEYRNCRKYRAMTYLFQGREDLAFADAQANLEDGFSDDLDVFVPALVRRGDYFSALLASHLVNGETGFPHKDYLAALAKGGADQETLDRLFAWAEASRVDIADRTFVMVAYGNYDAVTLANLDNDYENFWLPSSAGFRKSARFKELARDLGHLAYWRERGFPPQCRALKDDDFTCD